MPSKKKQSRTPSKLSTPDAHASPRTPSLTSIQDAEAVDEELRCSLDEASSHFPSLIGKSAIIGRVADVDSVSRGLKIWLSETSMVSAFLAPGSTVSVSLAPSGRRISNNFPLSSVTAEYGVDYESSTIREFGDYFVLATVFPSSKVLKNTVRFSLNLHYGLGCPASDRVVFVYPVCNHFLTDTANGRDGLPSTDSNHLSLHVCKELYLELTPLKNILEVNSSSVSAKKLSAESSHSRFESGNSTPVTPLHLQKLSSHSSNFPASPTCEGSVSSIPKQRSSSVNLYDLGEILSNESAKRLLQTCATSWLNSCSLLYGNRVALPMLSDMCIFRVKGANKLSGDGSSQDLNQNGQTVHLHAPEPLEHTNNAYIINQETKVYLRQPSNIAAEIPEGKVLPCLQLDHEVLEAKVECDFSKLGGLSKEFGVLKDIIISSSMKNALSSLGLQTTKGVLLHGPPGTGKTSLARLCAHDSGVNFFSVNGPEIISQYFGESEQALHEVFSSAGKAAPAVVFIDELDAIAPARKDGSEELSQRMVATLLNLMDGISRNDGVLVISATNRPDSIEPALRRPGRLDREIEIGVPSPGQRLDILQTLLGGMEHSLSDMHVQQLAMTTHGFVGADLAALRNEAALVCLRRHTELKRSSIELHSEEISSAASTPNGSDFSKKLRDCSDSASSCVTDLPVPSGSQPSSNLNGAISQAADDILDNRSCSSEQMLMGDEECTLKVGYEDFEKAKMKIRPSAMREVILEVPKVKWEDVGGQKEVKNQLMEAVEWPQKHQDAFKRIGARPPTGILMFGPPGCSKTLMARAVASEAGLNFLAVKGPELFSKWVGESEKAVRSVFAKARANAPSIIFFDEIDGLAVIRGKESDGISVSDRVMSQLLVELDGLHQRVDVTVIAATNRPDKIDSALLRPGRFDRLLYVGPPNETDREEIFKIHLRKIPCSSDVNLKKLASLTVGCTGADISLICREAAIAAMEESLEAKEITMRHLKAAISHTDPTEVLSYQELSAKFQRLVHSNSREERGEHQKCIRRRSFPVWTLIKSITMFFYRIIMS